MTKESLKNLPTVRKDLTLFPSWWLTFICFNPAFWVQTDILDINRGEKESLKSIQLEKREREKFKNSIGSIFKQLKQIGGFLD